MASQKTSNQTTRTRKKTSTKKKAPATQPKGRKKASDTKGTKGPSVAFEIAGLILIALSFLTMFRFGMIGAFLQGVSKLLIGNWFMLLPIFTIGFAIYMMTYRGIPAFKNRYVWGILLLSISVTLFSHIAMFTDYFNNKPIPPNTSLWKESWGLIVTEKAYSEPDGFLGGGLLGTISYSLFYSLADTTGSKMIGILLVLIGFILLTGKTLFPFIKENWPKWKEQLLVQKEEMMTARTERKEASEKQRAVRQERRVETASSTEEDVVEEHVEELREKPQLNISAYTQNLSQEERVAAVATPKVEQQLEEEEVPLFDVVSVDEANVENIAYSIPSMDLLELPPVKDQKDEFKVIEKNARTIEQTLEAFGVKANVSEVHLGPAVTEYEVLPERGVKVSKIVNLQDDMALALAAKDIRIEAPIPGKSAVGIEVPNKEISMVSLRSVLEASPSNKPDEKLVVGLGRDISGDAKLTKLNKMPHLLVAGSTGSGKSVCINGIIISILMRAKPNEVKMMMIDPKMVELNIYNGIPHLLAPVVTDARKASQALKKVVTEMERRYDLFSHTGTRNIEGYNKHVDRFNEENVEKHPRLPFIVVIVDELADLMLVAAGDVEDSIMRLAQMARAAGIHLIIATQRPSVDVLTGVIKANIPSRIAFAVSSQIDSRTILDMGGAERLLGRGDMLFLPAGESKPVRVQGAFVSDEEVEAVVSYVIGQQTAQYQEDMIPTDEEVAASVDDDTDELYEEAVKLVIEQDTASVSFLQRKLKVGYARAARIMDQMEEHGVVGPAEKSKPRQILIGK